MIGRLLGTFVLKIIRVRTALVAYSLMAIILLAISLVTEGEFSIILMLSCGFFNSIMWGSIFNLASEDLGGNTKRASGIICSFAIGGALLPPLMGMLQQSFGEEALETGTTFALSVYFFIICIFSCLRPNYLQYVLIVKVVLILMCQYKF